MRCPTARCGSIFPGRACPKTSGSGRKPRRRNERRSARSSQRIDETGGRHPPTHARPYARGAGLATLRPRQRPRRGARAYRGMARGAEGSRLGVRHALAEGFRGMDQALSASVHAGHEALRQLVAAGRASENELKQAAAGLRKLEEDFVATVEEVARSANERVRPELGELVRQAAHAGTETGRRSAKLMAEFTFGGLELAGEFGARFAQIAGGVLAGMADALDKRDRGKDSH